MPYPQPKKTLILSEYAGLVTTVNPHFQPPNSAQEILNLDLYEKGSLTARKGCLPLYPNNAIAPTAYQPIASHGYLCAQTQYVVYETSDGSVHAASAPSTSGSGNNGAPVIRSGFNTFEPLCLIKVPDGFEIGVNGLDRGLFYDGIAPVAYNLGMDAPIQAPTVTNEAGVGGGATAGTYQCFVRYLDQYGTASDLSPVATVTANDNDAFGWLIPVSSNPRTTQRELWRTLVNEGDTYYLAKIISDNSTTSFTDTLSDEALTQLAAQDPYYSMAFSVGGRPNANRYGIPPTWKKVVAWFQDRAFYMSDIVYTQGTVAAIYGTRLVFGNGVAWTPQMAGLYLYVVGAAKPYLIDAVSQTPAEVIEINHGGGSTNAVQLVRVASNVTSGTYTLSLNGHVTGNIAYNAPATGAGSVQSAIAALSNVGVGNVSVSGSAGAGYTVTFISSLAGTAEPAMVANSSGLSGFGITVTELQAGSASGTGNEQQLFGFDDSGGVIQGGEFVVYFNGHSTPPLSALGYTASQMETTLQALPSIGPNNCTVAKTTDTSTSQSWTVTFTGKFAGIQVPKMEIYTFPYAGENVNSSGVVYTGTLEPYVFVEVVGAGGANEIQKIVLPANVSGGTFTLTWNGQTTSAIAWDAPAEGVGSMEAALAALSNIGVGNVGVLGGSGTYTVTFEGSLGAAAQPLITGNGSSLTGGLVTVTVLQPGGSGIAAVQTIALPAATCGTWTAALDGATTNPIAYNAPATGAGSVQSALQALSTIGANNCTVTLSSTTYTITFGGSLAGKQIDQMTASGASLCGIPATVVELQAGSGGGGGGGGTDEVRAVGFATVDPGGAGCVACLVNGPGNGTFTLTWNGHTSRALQVHPYGTNNGYTPADLTAILVSDWSLNPGDLSITDMGQNGTMANVCGMPANANSFYGTSAFLWAITFTGTRANSSQPAITISTSGVTPQSCVSSQYTIQSFACELQAGGSGGGGGGAVNEVQQITLPSGTISGSFTVTAGGVTTAPLAFTATGNDLQNALGANFSATGNAGGPYILTYINALGGASQPLATVNTTSLNGGIITTSVVTPGGAGGNEVQLLILGSPTGGTYTLTWNAQTTSAIQWNAPATGTGSVQSALTALSNIGSGNIAVAGGPTAFTITFQGTLGNAAQNLISVDTSSLQGSLTASTITLDENYKGQTVTSANYAIRPAPAERNRVWFSEPNLPEAVPSVNEIQIQHDQNVDDEIVGAMPLNGVLYILKSNHIYGLTYDSQPAIDVGVHPVAYRGALNNRCCALAEGEMFLMDEWGMYAFNGVQVTKIGDPVQSYWRNDVLDFTRSKWFYVKADPNSQTVLFFVVFQGHQYPQHAFAYNYRLGNWSLRQFHREAASAAYLEMAAQAQGAILLGTTGETFFQLEQGTLDGTAGSGTLTGTVTTSNQSGGVTVSSTAWPADVAFASFAITSGGAKGQTRYITAANKTTAKIATGSAFTGLALGDTYLIGGIPWNYKTPEYRFARDDNETKRALHISFIPTTHPNTLDCQRTYDHNSQPDTVPQTQNNMGWGLSWQANSPDIVLDMTSTQSMQSQIVGWAPITDNQRLDMKTQGHRWVTYYLRGFQGQDQIKLVGLEFEGLDQG